MIDKLQKPKALPMPPSSPGVPAVFNQAPLFSLQGLRQRYERLPPFVKKIPGRTVGLMGLRNPYVMGLIGIGALAENPTMQKLAQSLPGGDLDFDFARKEAAKLPPKKSFEDLGISPLYDAANKEADIITKVMDGEVPVEPGTNQIAPSVIKKIENQSGITLPPDGGNIIKEADANDGFVRLPDTEPQKVLPEDIDKEAEGPRGGGEDFATIDITEEEADTEYNNRQQQNNDASFTFFSQILPQVVKSGRSAEALVLDQQVRDIMGPESKKSKNLLLLQLASNLISGRTDRPGFAGFLDVLGQAGQKTIPLALALEEQRREDERELKKALIASREKRNSRFKLGKTESIGVFLDENNERRKGPLRYDDLGIPYITVFDQDGKNPREINVSGRLIETLPFPDAKQKQEILNEIAMYSRALDGAMTVLDMATRRPGDIGALGTVKRGLLRIGDISQQVFGGLDFEEVRNDLGLVERSIYDRLDEKRSQYSDEEFEEVKKEASRYLTKLREGIQDMGTDDNTLARQAKIRSINLFTSYALANILKNKDRLAVQDIRRAEQITDAFGILKSPTDIIFAYKELSEQLREALNDKIEFADSIGISDAKINKLRLENEGEKDKRERQLKSINAFLDTLGRDPGSLDELIRRMGLDQIKILEDEEASMAGEQA